jgi:hypothetical protein
MPVLAEAPPAAGQRLGSLIGAVFGLIYVEANAAPLPAPVALSLRIAGAVAFAAILARLALARRAPAAPAGGFGRRYWVIVTLELLAIVSGNALLRGVGLGHAAVAWVSVVVGVHFVALARVWRLAVLRSLGAALAVCGTAGLAAAVAGAGDAVVSTAGGVLPGALLLVAAAIGTVRR